MWLEEAENSEDILFTDASGTGIGAYHKTAQECFRMELDREWVEANQFTIAHLEFWAVICGVKCWRQRLSGQTVKIRCDNMGVIESLNSYRARDTVMQQLLREMMFQEAVGDFRILARHIAGKNNTISDRLSRSHLGPASKEQADKMIQQHNLVELKFNTDWLIFESSW